MQQPEHLSLRPFQVAHSNPRRILTIAAVALFHVFVIVAFATGLANQLVQKLPDELKAEVVKEQIPVKPPPPPPPPDLAKPPPPFVPPPEITIQNEAPAPNAITVQHTVEVPPPPKAQGITAPASIGRTHECQRFYPPLAQRLNQEGTVTVEFHISADGTVSDPKVIESSGFDSLDQAALKCVPGW